MGYRHIDTAFVYGNESIIGKVLKEWLTSGKIKREDLFITTKLPSESLHEDLVESTLKQSLNDLQLDYVDLYLLHSPMYRKKDELTGEYATAIADHPAVWRVSYNLIYTVMELFNDFNFFRNSKNKLTRDEPNPLVYRTLTLNRLKTGLPPSRIASIHAAARISRLLPSKENCCCWLFKFGIRGRWNI